VNRRLPAIVVFVLLPVALLALFPLGVLSTTPPPTVPTFAALGEPTQPFVPNAAFINATWFCAGVPNAEDASGGFVTVANPTDAPLTGMITVFSDTPGTAPVEHDIEVAPRTTTRTVLAEVQPVGTYLSAMVEIAGGGGFVEQQANTTAGNAVSPCSNSTSQRWHFADNYTLNGSQEDLVVTNPFPDDAIINFTFASNDGTRQPQNLQGVPVPGSSIVVVDQSNMPKDEAVLAVTVEASRGRVVVGRGQLYLGERSGYSMTLGAPSTSAEWWFPDGDDGRRRHASSATASTTPPTAMSRSRRTSGASPIRSSRVSGSRRSRPERCGRSSRPISSTSRPVVAAWSSRPTAPRVSSWSKGSRARPATPGTHRWRWAPRWSSRGRVGGAWRTTRRPPPRRCSS